MFYVLIFCAINTLGQLLIFTNTHRDLFWIPLDVGNKCLIKRISGGRRKGEKLDAGSNSSVQGVLNILFGWMYRTLGKNFKWGSWFYDSQVRQFGWGNRCVCFFFWIKLTKHHKITIHCTFIHEPFLSFSTSENISLHWNMNSNLKLVSWITHPQPFSPPLNFTYLLNLTAVREKFYCFSADILPSLHVWSCCCYHLGMPHIQEGKISK